MHRDIRTMSWWKHKLRVTVFDESSYSELRVFRGSPRQWVVFAVVALLGVSGLTFALVALTPLREWVVPGYVAAATQQDMRETRAIADSLTAMLERQEMTIYALRHSLSGDPEAMLFLQQASERQDGEVGDIDSAWISAMQPGQDELTLRSRVEESDRFALQRRPLERESATTGFPFLPLVGGVSSGLDLGIGHLGVDLVAPEGSAIQAVDDGSVLFSSYTIETGYTLVLQHRSDRVSVYKHCASLLKRQGDLVAGGEAIALMGNTGDLTTGPHLHFEWWVRGRPTDPSPWLGSTP